jgi:multidrug transporter EmrE-like cation transporter
MKLALFPLLLFGVLLNAGAQLLLKAGIAKVGQFNFTLPNILPVTMQVAANPYIILGLTFYVVSVVLWLMVLSRVDVSMAYPMLSLGYVMNAIAAYYLFGENLSLTRIIGILVILGGVYLIARS